MPELLAPFFTVEGLIALLTLAALEIVLGIDNIIFISILVGKLPAEMQPRARRIGLLGAMFMRIGLLLALSWIMRLTKPLFTVFAHSFAGKDLILLVGGLFLVGKSTYEIHDKLEGATEHGPAGGAGARAAFGATIAQIMILDIVFSLDSVITAVGMASHIQIMIAAVVASVMVMLWLAGPIGDFVNRHPTLKILALSFLILIGVMLVAESFGGHVNKGYIYFAMAFSLAVELINMRMRPKVEPVHLHQTYVEETDPPAAPGGDSAPSPAP
ncbi:MAG: TerC family protein [Planctomycetes bacterium]|nr:TerC family protein [Planctomycetota bacterium]